MNNKIFAFIAVIGLSASFIGNAHARERSIKLKKTIERTTRASVRAYVNDDVTFIGKEALIESMEQTALDYLQNDCEMVRSWELKRDANGNLKKDVSEPYCFSEMDRIRCSITVKVECVAPGENQLENAKVSNRWTPLSNERRTAVQPEQKQAPAEQKKEEPSSPEGDSIFGLAN